MNKSTSYQVIGVIMAVVGLVQLYQGIYDRPAGASMSVIGVSTGLVFLLLGMWMTARGRRKP